MHEPRDVDRQQKHDHHLPVHRAIGGERGSDVRRSILERLVVVEVPLVARKSGVIEGGEWDGGSVDVRFVSLQEVVDVGNWEVAQ